MFEIKREVKALVLALEQRRLKAVRRPGNKARRRPEEVDPEVNVTLKDLHIEAKELQRAHRALSVSVKSLGGFWHSPSHQRDFVCPVCGSAGDVSSTQLDLSRSVEVDEVKLENAILETKASHLHWKLRSHDERMVDLQEDLSAAHSLCEELHAQLQQQTDEFQNFMVGVRATVGHWTARQNQLKEEMDELAGQIAPGKAEVVKLAEDLEAVRQKLLASQRRKSRRESTKHHQATLKALQRRILIQEGPPRETLQKLENDLQRKEDELLQVEAQSTRLKEALEAQKMQAEDQAVQMKVALEEAKHQGAQSARLEVKSTRAEVAKLEGSNHLPKGSVVNFLKMMAEGAPVSKLCAGNGRWQRRFLALTPGPPVAAKSIAWSSDAKYMGRRYFGRPTSVDIKEVVQVTSGADALPEALKSQEAEPWCCFSLWTPKRSFHFKAENEKAAENFVLGLSRVCPSCKPVSRSHLLVQRARGKLGPDRKSRAAALSKALRQAAASRAANV